jgi:hypothetical protein
MTSLGSALGAKRPRGRRRKQVTAGQQASETITVALPDTDPAMVERARLVERLAVVESELADIEALPPHMRPAGYRIEDLRESRVRLAAAIAVIPTEVEVPAAWWTLPIGHPHRELAAHDGVRAAAAQAAKAAQVQAPAPAIDPEADAIASSLKTLADAAPAAPPAANPHRSPSRRSWRERVEDSKTGRNRDASVMIEVPNRTTGGTRLVHKGWPMCGAPTLSGKPCAGLVWFVRGRRWSCDGLCWRHTVDPRGAAIRARRIAALRAARSNSLRALAAQHGINYGTLRIRLYRNRWPLEKALTTPGASLR